MTPDEYCQNQTANSGSSFYLSFFFLSPERRQAINALYAFCREVDDVVDECTDSAVARARLQWWHDEIGRLFSGKPQHPVTRALAPVISRFSLSEEYFHEIIDGMEMDLDEKRYSSFQDLSLYCYRVAGVVGLLSAEIFGYEDRHTLRYAHDLGMAFQLTNILRDVREDAARGRIYIPLDEMEKHGVTEEDLINGRMTEGMRELLRTQAQRARTFYKAAFNKLPEQDRYPQRSGLIMAAVYLAILDKIEAQGFPVLDRRVTLPRWKRLWLAWRTGRLEARRHRKFVRSKGK